MISFNLMTPATRCQNDKFLHFGKWHPPGVPCALNAAAGCSVLHVQREHLNFLKSDQVLRIFQDVGEVFIFEFAVLFAFNSTWTNQNTICIIIKF